MIDLNYLFKNPYTGKGSITRTAFSTGFIIAGLKLLLSGVRITDTYMLPAFSGVEFAAVVGALGAVYGMSKNNAIKAAEKNEDKEVET